MGHGVSRGVRGVVLSEEKRLAVQVVVRLQVCGSSSVKRVEEEKGLEETDHTIMQETAGWRRERKFRREKILRRRFTKKE